jgi:1-aminocyclopropane-1-carboxylate deaminase/D-cysteine desulfhydrase-like pyridoxal-dependent ACC family enzyme
MTAAAATLAGMRAVLVLTGDDGTAGGNLLLDHLLGAETCIVPDDVAEAAKMEELLDKLRRAGEREVRPSGCSRGQKASFWIPSILRRRWRV